MQQDEPAELESKSAQHNPLRLPVKNPVIRKLVGSALGTSILEKYYDQWLSQKEANRYTSDGLCAEFLDFTLSAVEVEASFSGEHLDKQLPEQGPVVVVANHPLGGLEGMLMTRELLKRRPDTKVLTNQMLTRFPEFNDVFIGVDVLSSQAVHQNGAGIKAACRHLSKGGVLLIYPAGMVSAINLKTGRIEDREWNVVAARLARKYKAQCLPMYVTGRNSRMFYMAGLIHPRLRTAMLARELCNKRGQKVPIKVGGLISHKEMLLPRDDASATHYLRMMTEMLDSPDSLDAPQHPNLVRSDELSCAPSLEEHLKTLQSGLLLQKGKFSVYCAEYEALGPFTREIALAREITFRAVGEGSGDDLDTDNFDPHYLHLFVWDEEHSRLVGGYRIGRADEIAKSKGIKALYSRSLYHFDQGFLDKLGGAIEVGRSFVIPEYQRHPRALDVLLQGIGRFMAKNPDYHTLFGCVSISQQHSALARAFLSDSMLAGFRAEQQFLNEVRPLAPLKVKGKIWSAEILASLNNIAIINKLLGQMDGGKAVPILLRHYLSLNGRFVCFSVNRKFNNSLDGLIIVDLRNSPQKYVARYLGKEGSEKFIQRWEKHEALA